MYGAIGGLEKLQKERPSTAYFGNGDVMEGVRSLSDSRADGGSVRLRPLVGKNKTKNSIKEYLKLGAGDSEAKVTEQWRALQAAFSRPDAVLLYHLKNHYALIFGLREWQEPATGQPVRQLLTTRRGQRPTVWLDWAEARRTILGWVGYKIMLAERTDSMQQPVAMQQPPAAGAAAAAATGAATAAAD
eukprot:SAG22_NODE_5912_length_932_cov_1.188475_2_plen_188_part_01